MMAGSYEFDISPLGRFQGKSQPLKRPKEITYFSYDIERQFHPDASSMQYYYPPSLPLDLSKGHDSFVRWDDSTDEHLDGLLKSIKLYEEEKGEKIKTDFVTWRGMMTKIMAVPFDRFNSQVLRNDFLWRLHSCRFEMNATCFQGSIYIEEHHEAQHAKKVEQTQRPPNRPGGPSQDLMSYWGYKFEAVALIPDIWDQVSREYIENRESLVVDNIQQYCSVVHTGIGSSTLVLGGEVDAVWDRKPDDPEQPINWVELKTSEEIQSEHDKVKFERKLLKFWLQSFLLGVPKIIVGFRSKDGMLIRLEEFSTQSIPGLIKRQKNSWDGNTCVNFAAAFLEFLKNTITGEGVWRIRRTERSPIIEVFRVTENGTGSIILDDFVQWRQNLVAQQVAQMLK